MVRGANAPVIIRTITEQLEYEHKVLKGEAQRKPVNKKIATTQMLKLLLISILMMTLQISDPYIEKIKAKKSQEKAENKVKKISKLKSVSFYLFKVKKKQQQKV